jgi:lipopolysaccharide assembly protein A
MGYLRRILLLLLLPLVGIWGFLFALANSTESSLDLVFMELPAAAMSVWVIAAFVLGGICGLLAASGAIWRVRRRVNRKPGAAVLPANAAQR